MPALELHFQFLCIGHAQRIQAVKRCSSIFPIALAVEVVCKIPVRLPHQRVFGISFAKGTYAFGGVLVLQLDGTRGGPVQGQRDPGVSGIGLFGQPCIVMVLGRAELLVFPIRGRFVPTVLLSPDWACHEKEGKWRQKGLLNSFHELRVSILPKIPPCVSPVGLWA